MDKNDHWLLVNASYLPSRSSMGILTVIKIISKRYKERRGYNPLGDSSDVSINASYNDHQIFIWFMGGDFNHFQYN